MQLTIKVDSKEFERALKEAPVLLERNLRIGLKEVNTLITRQARSSHRFKTRSGNLERSVQSEVKNLTSEIYLEPGIAVYGRRIHEGYGKWNPDQFLYRAAETKEQEATKILDEAIGRALNRAGLTK